jgi:hypothetical protein
VSGRGLPENAEGRLTSPLLNMAELAAGELKVSRQGNMVTISGTIPACSLLSLVPTATPDKKKAP